LNDVVKANIPIVALTANALVGDDKEYYGAGMNACRNKSFTQEKLFAIFTRLLDTTLDLKQKTRSGKQALQMK
jgi:CheY-like chemotaxis protein